MIQDLVYCIAGIALFAVGLFAVIAAAHIIRKLIAVNIMGIGVFMVLLVTARHDAITDPVPHAMVLTGIVVAVAGTALCLWLTLSIHKLGTRQIDNTAPGNLLK